MDIKNIKQKTIFSTILLFFQTGYSSILGLVTNIILTIYLDPSAFGVYIAVLAAITIFNYVSDIGLGGALIQKKEATKADIQTTFTLQIIITGLLVGIGYVFSSHVATLYNLPPGGLELYYAVLIAFFLSSLKSVPSLLLERQVQFGKVVFVQALEQTVFNIVVSVLAISGLGLYSFVYAVLLRAISGTGTMYLLTRFRPSLGISFSSVKDLLSFGLPFQASSFLALIKDELATLYLSKLLGFADMGMLGWAKKWAETPLRLIMDNIGKVLFPVFSRLQDNKEELGKLVEKTLFAQTLLIAPIFALLMSLMETIVAIIPKYNKWEGAIPLFIIFSVSALLSSFSTPFITILNSLKKTHITFFFMLLWTILTWVLVPYLTVRYGLFGFPIASIILSSLFILVVITTKQFLRFQFLKPVSTPLLSAAIAGFGMNSLVDVWGNTFFSFVVSAMGGMALYLICIVFIFRAPIMPLLDLLRKR